MKNHYTPILALFSTAARSFVQAADFSIDPNQIAIGTRESWCKDELSNCPLLCGDEGVGENGCDHTTLSYSCVCGNGTAPGLEYYAGTMPTYICNQAYDNCVAGANQTDATAGQKCKDDIKSQCGILDPATVDEVTAASSSTSTSTTSTALLSATETSSSSSSSSSSSTTTTTTPSTSSESSDSTTTSQSQDGLTMEAKLGIGLGVTITVAGLLAIAAILLHRVRKARQQEQSRLEKGNISGPFEKLPEEPLTPPSSSRSQNNNTWSSYKLPNDSRPSMIELEPRRPQTAELFGGVHNRTVSMADLPGDTTSGWYDDDDGKISRVKPGRHTIRFPDFK